MAKFTTTQTFADAEQVTSTKLNAIISGLSADADLAADSTITITSGAIKVGVISASNIGADAVTTAKILNANVTAAKLATDAVETAKIKDANVTEAKLASDSVSWTKTLTADRAVQADMQSETASHFVSPSVLKYHPGVSKAGGIVAFENGSATVTGAYNVTSATDTGSGRQVTLAVTMANTLYRVQACYIDSGSVGAALAVTVNSTTQFTIYGTEATGRKIMFDVFGTLA